MKLLTWFLMLFVAAVTISLAANVNTGEVTFLIHGDASDHLVRISLNTFLLLLIGTFPLIYGLLRLVFITLALPEKVKAYRSLRRRQILMRDSVAGVIALFSGRYRKAERSAQRALESHPEPDLALLNSLVAARAAHYARNDSAREQHLAHIDITQNDDAALAYHMTRARLAYEARDLPSALAAIAQAREISPSLTSAIQLELSIRQRLEQPDKVLALLDPLVKAEALPANIADRYREQAYRQQLKQQHLDTRQWVNWWQKVPANLRVSPVLARMAARHFQALGETGLALNIVVQALEHEWDTLLLEIFGDPTLHAAPGMLLKHIQLAESWLPAHARDAALLLALARLCQAQQLWGKARSYAEASLAIEPSAMAHLILASLAEQDGSPEAAGPHLRQALALALDA